MTLFKTNDLFRSSPATAPAPLDPQALAQQVWNGVQNYAQQAPPGPAGWGTGTPSELLSGAKGKWDQFYGNIAGNGPRGVEIMQQRMRQQGNVPGVMSSIVEGVGLMGRDAGADTLLGSPSLGQQIAAGSSTYMQSPDLSPTVQTGPRDPLGMFQSEQMMFDAEQGLQQLGDQTAMLGEKHNIDVTGANLAAQQDLAQLGFSADKLKYLINSADPRDRQFAQRWLALQKRQRGNEKDTTQFQRDVTDRQVKSDAIAKGAMHFPGRKWGLDDSARTHQLANAGIDINSGKDQLGYDEQIAGLDDQLFNANVDLSANQNQGSHVNSMLANNIAGINLGYNWDIANAGYTNADLQQQIIDAAALEAVSDGRPLSGWGGPASWNWNPYQRSG